jgi:hypothetical protein
MEIQKPIINNIFEYTDSNVQKIIKLINSHKIISIEDLNNYIIPDAINMDNNNKIIDEFKSINLKNIKKIVDQETIKVVVDSLPVECKIKNPEIKDIEIDNDNELNELIKLINTKFNIINKIL